jgi:hypothetical protein
MAKDRMDVNHCPSIMDNIVTINGNYGNSCHKIVGNEVCLFRFNVMIVLTGINIET